MLVSNVLAVLLVVEVIPGGQHAWKIDIYKTPLIQVQF